MNAMRWVKFYTNAFDGISFKRIKRMKGAASRDKLTAVWIELLVLAGVCNDSGNLFDADRNTGMSIEDIAIFTDRKESDIEKCIEVFVKEKMIDYEDGVYHITNWYKYQSEDKLEQIRQHAKERQRRHREKQKNKFNKYLGANSIMEIKEEILTPSEYISIYLDPNKSWVSGTSGQSMFDEMFVMYMNMIGVMDGVVGKSWDCIADSTVVEYIKSMPYDQFLKTPYWKAIAAHIKEVSMNKCHMCGCTENLNVHHKTYDRHGYEHTPNVMYEDLLCLCKDCHTKIHEKDAD